MKTDLYTKSILTVIAACLLSIVFRGTLLIPAAHAEGLQFPTDVNIDEIGGVAVAKSALPVKIKE
jgi:hypothetical protein